MGPTKAGKVVTDLNEQDDELAKKISYREHRRMTLIDKRYGLRKREIAITTSKPSREATN